MFQDLDSRNQTELESLRIQGRQRSLSIPSLMTIRARRRSAVDVIRFRLKHHRYRRRL
jgi:hypothetical protein